MLKNVNLRYVIGLDDMHIAVLITCFNRKTLTVECIQRLISLVRQGNVVLDVWVNDDGSTDGTSEAILALTTHCDTISDRGFHIHLIRGSGHDYWCGGMRRAWQTAIDSGIKYDGYLLLNDDTMLESDAIAVLTGRHNQGGIVVGAIRDPETGVVTYSGRDADGMLMIPNGEYQPCVMMNANAVFVSRKAFEVLGNFPDYFTHSLGDYDYARRAVENGIPVWVTPKYVGTCENKKPKAIWTDPAQPLCRRLKDLYSPLSGVQPRIFFRYNWYHDGLWQAMRLWMSQHLRVFFPRLWR